MAARKTKPKTKNPKRRNRIIAYILLACALALGAALAAFTPADRAVLLSRHKSIDFNGVERKYLEFKPKRNIDKIVLGFHGFSDHARRFAYYTALHNATDENTLVIYPEATEPRQPGVKKGWNAKICCGSGFVNDYDDVGFIISLVKQLKQQHGADTKVFAAGFSNGAMFAQRLAAEYPEEISGLAAVGGSLKANQKQIKPSVPVPVLLMHGIYDKTVPYGGGVGKSDPDFSWQPFKDTVKQWQANNQDKAAVEVIEFEDSGHSWRGWRLGNFWHKHPDTTLKVIDFFESI